MLINLAGAFGYAQSTVLCLKEEGRHALEFSADGYRCSSSTAMAEPAFHCSDRREIPLADEHCGSCVDTPLSTLIFAINCSSTRPSIPGFDVAMPALLAPAVYATGTVGIDSALARLLIVATPTFASLTSTILLI